MKSLYYIKVYDKTTKRTNILHIVDMQHVEAIKVTKDKDESYDLDFSNSNPGLVEDMVKAAEWLKKHLKAVDNEVAEVYIQSEIFTSSIEFDGRDDIWECLEGAIEICRGEYLTQYGSSVITQGYNILEKYVTIG